MSKIISRLALAAVAVLLLGSCSQINERLDKLESRIGGIENETIKSIDGQISAINQSIADLGSIRSSIQSLTQTAGSQDVDIESLQKADKAIGERIDSLSAYVNGELVNYAKTEWVNATFSTLAQYEETCDTIAKIDARIGALDTRLSVEIAAIVDSLNWINAQFGSYYTAAQMDAKLDVLQEAIDSAKAENKPQADSIAAELTETKAAVDSAKANIRAEYRIAVDTAITALDGKLSKALQDSIAAVNGRIDNLEGSVKAINDAVYALMGRVDRLEKMIQSVRVIPAYSDGSVEVKDGFLYLDIIVQPAEAVAGLTKDSLTILVNKVKTKTVSIDQIPVEGIKVDAAKGTVIARADISSKLPVASGNALAVAVNVKKGLSDITTDFYPVEVSAESSVTVTAAIQGNDTTKISIAADEDFPKSVMGNIAVDEGFDGDHSTTIEVEGIGTITFDEDAAKKIKENAGSATNILIKVEDITETLANPVPDADVVLEVTMKAVDEEGTEVFSKEKAAGTVTIAIPIVDDDVVFVSKVILVDDNGIPIANGVDPETIKLDLTNRVLSFEVKHFSKYAVGYVKSKDFVSVTGVTLNKNEMTLAVSGTETLTATFAPNDATNTNVIWTSSNNAVATVEKGKVTAVAVGTATITVTTEDVVKTTGQPATATCTVTVKTKAGTEPYGHENW